jgi:hypothetical protein
MAISFFGVGTSWEPTSANDHADLETPSGVPDGALMIATVVTSNSAAVVTPLRGRAGRTCTRRCSRSPTRSVTST